MSCVLFVDRGRFRTVLAVALLVQMDLLRLAVVQLSAICVVVVLRRMWITLHATSASLVSMRMIFRSARRVRLGRFRSQVVLVSACSAVLVRSRTPTKPLVCFALQDSSVRTTVSAKSALTVRWHWNPVLNRVTCAAAVLSPTRTVPNAEHASLDSTRRRIPNARIALSDPCLTLREHAIVTCVDLEVSRTATTLTVTFAPLVRFRLTMGSVRCVHLVRFQPSLVPRRATCACVDGRRTRIRRLAFSASPRSLQRTKASVKSARSTRCHTPLVLAFATLVDREQSRLLTRRFVCRVSRVSTLLHIRCVSAVQQDRCQLISARTVAPRVLVDTKPPRIKRCALRASLERFRLMARSVSLAQ